MVGFDKAGNSSGNFDLQNIAQSMVGTGAGIAFDAVGMNLPDITVLGKRDGNGDDEEDMGEETEQSGGDNAAAQASPTKRPAEAEEAASGKKKKAKWFDLGGSINSTRRQLRSAATGLKASLEEVALKLQKATKEVDALPAAQKKLFLGECKVAEVRLAGCQHVLGTSEPELQSYIKSFENTGEGSAAAALPPSSGASAAGDDSSSAAAMGALAKMPPCGSYQQPVLFSTLDACIDELYSCHSDEGIKAVTNNFNTKKLPLLDLLSTSNKAVTDIAKARKVASDINKKNGKGEAAGAAATDTPSILFEESPSVGQEVPVFQEGKLEGVKYHTPFVITSSPSTPSGQSGSSARASG